MAKQNNDCYTDNIKVKISEKYKPPPRINLAISYAQRINLNKQIQDNIPSYEFSLEKTALIKMKEWKKHRVTIAQERKDRIDSAREEYLKKKRNEQESIDKEKIDEIELKTANEAATTATSTSFMGGTNVSSISRNYGRYSANDDILVPTQITNPYSNILTPIPLQNYSNQQYPHKTDKSPFNISDFENDTSSPFDNMELKSINDMEELAQVLNRDKTNYKPSPNINAFSNFPSVRPTTTQVQPTYSNYMSNQYSYSIPNSASYVRPVVSDYSSTNGFYYDTNPFQTYAYKPSPPTEYYTPSSQSLKDRSETKTTNCKSVPDIVKALENEIENTHISTSVPQESYVRNETVTQNTRPKSIDAVYPRPKIKKDELDDPFQLLTKSQQDLCMSISSMGFPLSRVARICQILGDDQKKVVDHLLALSDLLDLGFAEKDISLALVECDNDKDKALDKLIS
ncbi:ubiquitin-associated protein 1 [Diorhabda carinulata]|uniref:ubiquitin-associated protein 1 n=1 Tax=Diorhabda carinulata TaxID=1163345 RepID=UPI0025A123B0|nr:ubiquitin-associated protein 1 [Diorhabda carinulata]XP_057665175.1 ubiquitin-associated protein 1 [Diorhabda carinulata]